MRMHPCWLLVLMLAACDGNVNLDDDDDTTTAPDDDDDDDTVDLPDAPRGECALADKVGWFEVQHEVDYSAVYGLVADGVVPTTILQNVGEQGGCRLMQRINPFCDPPCQPGETCDHSGECIPYPANHSVGTVTIEGLSSDVAMDPTMTNDYFDTTIEHPPFAPGADIVLTASGDDYAAFAMVGQGVAPIETSDETWIVRSGQDLTMTWTPADQEHAEIYIRLNIDQHGNSPVEIVCSVPDTGSADIPSSVIDQLLGFGVTGFPSGNLARRTVDKVDIEPGCVQFTVFSHLLGSLQVEGHIPCAGPDDCPPGMECDIPTGTCI